MILANIIIISFLLPFVVASTTQKCPQGWYYNSAFGACYGVSAGGIVDSWNSAEEYCTSFGGHLPSIHSFDEFDFIQSYAYITGDNIWTGFYTSDGGQSYKSLDKTETAFMNNLTNWCFGSFSGSLKNRCIAVGEAYGLKCLFDTDCSAVKMHTICKKAIDCLDQNGNPQISPFDSWVSNNCSTFNTCWKDKLVSRPYRCDVEEKCVVMDSQESCQSRKCEIGWRFYSTTSFCYKVIHDVDVIAGENLCQVEDSHLASIHTMDENSFVMGMVQIGSIDIALEDSTLIGANITYNPYNLAWTDGTEFNFNNGMAWPNAYGLTNPTSFAMYTDNATPGYGYLYGSWFLLANNTVLRNGICKKNSMSLN